VKHRRVAFSPKPETMHAMLCKAQRDKISLARVTQELVDKGLEEEEERWLIKLAVEAERASEGKPTYEAEDVWKELNIE